LQQDGPGITQLRVVRTIIAATALALVTRTIISTTTTTRHLHQFHWTGDGSMTCAFTTNMTSRVISTTTTARHLQQIVFQDDRSMTSALTANMTGRIISATAGKGRGRQHGGSNKNCKQLNFHDFLLVFQKPKVFGTGKT
jgi:hypothetical protein